MKSNKPKRKKRFATEKSDKTQQNKQQASQAKGTPSPTTTTGTAAEADQKKQRMRLFVVLGLVSLCAIAIILWLAIPHGGSSGRENNQSGLEDSQTLTIRNGFPLHLEGTTVQDGNFVTQNGNLYYVSDTSFVSLNPKGESVLFRSHGFHRPKLVATSKETLLYYVGGTGYRLENDRETVKEGQTEQPILAATLAENGRYAMVTESKGYPSLLSVYDQKGELLYTYRFASCYVTAVTISPDGNRIGVVGMSASGGQLSSEIYLLDCQQEEPIAKATVEDTLLLSVYYDGGNLLAVGDNQTVSLAPNSETQSYPYGDLHLSAYDNADGQLLLALSPHDRNSQGLLVLLGKNCQVLGELQCDDAVTSVSLLGNTMATLSHNTVSLYSVTDAKNILNTDRHTATPIYQATVSSDTTAIALASERSCYLLGLSEIGFVSF